MSTPIIKKEKMEKKFHCIICHYEFMAEPKPIKFITGRNPTTKEKVKCLVRDLSNICPVCGERATTAYFEMGS